MFRLLPLLFDHVVKTGDLRLFGPAGGAYRFGDGTGDPIVIRLTDRRLEFELACNPELVLGEAYMDGRLTVERGSIYQFLALVFRNLRCREWPSWVKLLGRVRRAGKRVQQYNPVPRARRNARFHYNIDSSIYDLFLDPDRQYSCAYYEHEGQPLADAQLAKKRHLAAKLQLRDGQRVLDIGSGWGGLALYLARTARVDVTGITLSDEQLAASRERARRLGIAGAAKFEPVDYREMTGHFDRIVSVGMFEHVGVCHYTAFFEQLRSLLADDGVAVLHSIGRFDGPSVTNPFIAHYIFPGGYIPSLSEVLPAIEKSGLLVTDVEILRLHYAETLRHWRRRFLASWDRASQIKDERFCRMWEFYLAASEAAFRYQDLMVFQIQLTRDQATLPLLRDYMMSVKERCARGTAPLPKRQGSPGNKGT
ncbi:MAG: class I SAM-dependent methyltransferase [Methyloligellaceae bacterium]